MADPTEAMKTAVYGPTAMRTDETVDAPASVGSLSSELSEYEALCNRFEAEIDLLGMRLQPVLTDVTDVNDAKPLTEPPHTTRTQHASRLQQSNLQLSMMLDRLGYISGRIEL